MIKKIVLVLAVIGLVAAFIAYKMYNKPHVDTSATPMMSDLTAEALITAFKENESEANAKYLDRMIGVTGKIISIKTENNKTIIQLDANDPMSAILCTLDPLRDDHRTDFKEGEDIHMKGLCSGYLSDVILDRCVEIKN
jgi:hypothetical protein